MVGSSPCEQQGCLQGHGQAMDEAVANIEGLPVLALAETAPAHQGSVAMDVLQGHVGDGGRLARGVTAATPKAVPDAL